MHSFGPKRLRVCHEGLTSLKRRRGSNLTRSHDCFENSQRIGGSLRLALFEVLSELTHGIGDVREAEHPRARAFGEGVEGGSLHFYREHALGLRRFDRLGGFAKRSVRRPT